MLSKRYGSTEVGFAETLYTNDRTIFKKYIPNL